MTGCNTERDIVDDKVEDVFQQLTDIGQSIQDKRDMHSIWLDGNEMKIMEYLDEKSMCVKLDLGVSIVQTTVPRYIEDSCKISYDYETYGDTYLSSIRCIHEENALLISCLRGENVNEVFKEFVTDYEDEKVYRLLGDESRVGYPVKIKESELNNYSVQSDLDGYAMAVYDAENEIIVFMEMFTNDRNELEQYKKYLENLEFKRKEDKDFVSDLDIVLDDYDVRMENMYSRYQETLQIPSDFIKETCEAPGEEYRIHYFYDFTNDGVPEIIYYGNPKWICIIGEKNAVNLGGSEIIWSETPSEFYVYSEWTGERTWIKYKMEVNENGFIEANIIDREYLSSEYSYENDEYSYIYQGKNITEEKFIQIMDSLKSVRIRTPVRFLTGECMATKLGFYRCAMHLNDDFINK